MKRIITALLIAVLCISAFIPCLTVASASNAVEIKMSFEGTAKVDEEMALRITVGKPTTELAGLEFALDYDAEMLTPTDTVNDEDGGVLAQLIKKMPEGWEQLCHYSQTEKRYYFRFAMTEEASPLKGEGEIVLEIPFIVEAAGVITFNLPDKEVMAIANDEKLSVLSGKGEEFTTVAAGKTEKFAIDVGDNDKVDENGVYYVNITVTNIGDAEGIIAFEFGLRYNPSYFKPLITQNDNGQMDGFIKSAPQNAWEQMCTLYEEDNKYTLRFAALHAESAEECEKLELGKSVKISVPFKVVGKEGESGRFVCNTVTAKGINNKNEIIGGVGDLKTVSIGERISFVPQWIYASRTGYVFAPDNQKIADFLAPLGEGYSLSNQGEAITEGLVKTGYTLTNGKESLTVVVKGDVNCNGIVDSMDYVYTKRVYYGTYKVEGPRFYATAVSNGEKVNSMDYVYIKRHYFGTYNLNR